MTLTWHFTSQPQLSKAVFLNLFHARGTQLTWKTVSWYNGWETLFYGVSIAYFHLPVFLSRRALEFFWWATKHFSFCIDTIITYMNIFKLIKYRGLTVTGSQLCLLSGLLQFGFNRQVIWLIVLLLPQSFSNRKFHSVCHQIIPNFKL